MMSKMSKREYLWELKTKYRKSSKKEKGRLLDDFCAFTGLHRKSALRSISKPLPPKFKHQRNRQREYDQEVVDALVVIWRAFNEICAERFHPEISTMIDKLVICKRLMVSAETQEKLLKISLATTKRIVSKAKRRSLVKIGGTTKPGNILKRQIAIRYGRWDEMEPGWCEMDTVAHCGDNSGGDYISSLDVVDICSGWSEQSAILNKGEAAVTKEMDGIQNRLPFKLQGLDPDNGAEFINWSLFHYCKKHEVNLTRSRPYHKNDNAHVEQKNWTAIRQLVGYARLDKKEQLDILNDLYAYEWRLYINFFLPTLKLKEKIKDTATGRTKKKYYEAKTPCQRLMEHPAISKKTKTMLKNTYDRLDPITLQEGIKKKLELLKKTLK